MARTAPISGPLSFLIVALAAIFLNPGPAERRVAPVESPASLIDELGPPVPAMAPESETETVSEDGDVANREPGAADQEEQPVAAGATGSEETVREG